MRRGSGAKSNERGKLENIQVLRALAALSVVVTHADAYLVAQANKRGVELPLMDFFPWEFGVDLFFIISGVIMVYAHEQYFGNANKITTFLKKRVFRILPLYWVLTAAYIPLQFWSKPLPAASAIASSFFLIPDITTDNGLIRPILQAGWTLQYEFFFYAIFAAFLFLKKPAAILSISATLCAVAATSIFIQDSEGQGGEPLYFYSRPIILEFVYGMWLAVALKSKQGILSGWFSVLLVAVSITALVLAADVPMNWRWAALGLPSASIMLAALAGPGLLWASESIKRFVLLLGDSSYSLYLVHPFSTLILSKAFGIAGLIEIVGKGPLVVIEIIASIALAILSFKWLEKPMHKWLTAWTSRSGDHSSTH